MQMIIIYIYTNDEQCHSSKTAEWILDPKEQATH